jgi:hypothetical protein
MGLIGYYISNLLCNILILAMVVVVLIISIPLAVIISLCEVVGTLGIFLNKLLDSLIQKTDNLIKVLKTKEN